MRILVVDDEPAIRELYGRILRSAGYELTLACDGAEASELLSSQAYDLLITDHIMPKLTGVELIKRLRSQRLDIPTIMISGSLSVDDPDFSDYVMEGHFLAKPFTARELLEKITFVLQGVNRASNPSRRERTGG